MCKSYFNDFAKDKSFKLADFGLSIDTLKTQPFSYGASDLLAPEILILGPGSLKVIYFLNLISD
jgi:hypothetical protein